MTASTEMSTPVTRGELLEALEVLKAELKAELATKAELLPLATKAELELWGGALLARINSSEQRLSAEMARQFGAFQEWMTARFVAADEKYETLPDRVCRLETAVFGPK